MLLPVHFGNKALYILKNQIIDWGKCYFNPEENLNTKDCDSFIRQISWMMAFAALCVVVKKYMINIPCAFQSRIIHAKMIFRVLHAELTEYLSRTSLG
jgi:ABC-type multidrug transport system fused ATPase/permease subunit